MVGQEWFLFQRSFLASVEALAMKQFWRSYLLRGAFLFLGHLQGR